MNPLYIDIGLMIVIALMTLGGWRSGFVRSFGGLVGLLLSVALGAWGVQLVANATGFDLTANPITFLFAFLILSAIISYLLRLVVSALDLVRKILSIIPFVGLINSLLGLVVGFGQGLVIVAAIAYVTVQFLPLGPVRATLLKSELIHRAVQVEVTTGIL